MTEPALLRADDLCLRRGGTTVIETATFTLPDGLWLLRGANGSGKSTLLRALAGLGGISRGSITIDGHSLTDEPVAARRALGYAPQSAEVFGYLAVQEFLQTVAALRRTDVAAAEERARRWITNDCLDRRIDTLSAGQRRKLCLCAALCGQPKVLLLDEPDAGLDVEAVEELRTAIHANGTRGRLALVATHTEMLSLAETAGTLHVDGGRIAVEHHTGPAAAVADR